MTSIVGLKTAVRVLLFLITGALSLISVLGLFSLNDRDLPGFLVFVPCCLGLFMASIWSFWGSGAPGRCMQALSLLAYSSIFFTPSLSKDIRIDSIEVGALFLVIASLAQVAVVTSRPKHGEMSLGTGRT